MATLIVKSAKDKDKFNAYTMSKEAVNKVLKAQKESNIGTYFIFCVAKSDEYMLVREIFKDRQELNSQVAKYMQQGFKVYKGTGG